MRGDAGEYSIKAVNPTGENEEKLTVIVLTSPTAPQGPLEVRRQPQVNGILEMV